MVAPYNELIDFNTRELGVKISGLPEIVKGLPITMHKSYICFHKAKETIAIYSNVPTWQSNNWQYISLFKESMPSLASMLDIHTKGGRMCR